MRFISLGTINIHFLIPVSGGIIRLIYLIFINYSPKIEIINQNPFIESIYMTIAMCLAFIPFLINKLKIKAAIKKKNEQIAKLPLYITLTERKNIFKKTKFKKYRFIFYSTIFDALDTLLTIIYTKYFVFNLWIFDIYMSFFSFLFLKTKYYKHQFISMIVIVILGLGLNIITYFNFNSSKNILKPIDIFIKFISEISFCLIIVIDKYNLEKNYADVYEMCFFKGIFEFIIFSICLAVFCKYRLSVNGIKHPDNLIKYLKEFNYNDLIVCLSTIITYFIYNISVLKTNDYLTPIHILIILIINQIYNHFQTESNSVLNILSIFILLLITIMFLVFIEVIEINICSLSYNTKKNIELRARKDCLIEFASITFSNDDPELDEEEKSTISNNFISNN